MMSLQMLLIMMRKQGIEMRVVPGIDARYVEASPLMLACWNTTRELMEMRA